VDYFICDIFYPGVDPMPVMHTEQINIGVEPLIVQNPFRAHIGEKVAITTQYLDAGKLANVTGYMPVTNKIIHIRAQIMLDIVYLFIINICLFECQNDRLA
jgi:hypothetical protein